MLDKADYSLSLTALFLCAISFLAFSFKLNEISLYHTDEQYYIQSTRNMLDSGDFITPVLNDEKRFAKPILFYWLTAISFKAFGVSLTAARLVSSLLGAFCLWVTFRLGSNLFDRRTGLYSIAILATSYLFFLSSRLAYTDMALCFFITMSIFFLSRLVVGSGRKEGDSYSGDAFYFYLFSGLATATKGPPGFLIPWLLAAVFLTLVRDRRTARRLINWPGIVVFLLVSFFWPAAMLWLHGDAFINHLYREEGVRRLLNSESPGLYFFLVVLRYFPPWSLFLVAAGFMAFGGDRRLLMAKERRTLFLWLWIAVPLVMFTLLVRTHHSRYMLPAAPAAAILVGSYFQRIAKGEIPSDDPWFRVCCGLTAALYMILGIATLAAGFILLYLDWKFLTWAVFLLPAIFILGAVFLVRSRKKGEISALPYLISAPLLVSFPLLAGTVLPSLDPKPMAAFAEEINGSWISGTRIGSFSLGNENQRLRVLTGRPSISVEDQEGLYAFLRAEGPLFFVMRQGRFNRLPGHILRGVEIVGEAGKWKKIKLNKEVIDGIIENFGPGTLERFREKVLLLHKGKDGQGREGTN